MRQLTVADTLALSIPERIQLVEDIWDTIHIKTDTIELTENEKKLIDKRLESYHQNPDLGIPWDKVLKNIIIN